MVPREAPLDEDLEPSFLPFLDVLFAAIGIFLILIVQALDSGSEPRRMTGDVLLLVRLDGVVQWHEPGRADAEIPRLLDAGALRGGLGELAQRLGRNPAVVMAYASTGIDRARQLAREISELTTLRPDAPSGFAPRVTEWPLPADAEAIDRFIDEWLGHGGSTDGG